MIRMMITLFFFIEGEKDRVSKVSTLDTMCFEGYRSEGKNPANFVYKMRIHSTVL
jgi:hypothetical protein